MRDQATAVGLALLVLAIGFALADTTSGRALGDLVAQGLTALALPVLDLMEPGLTVQGTELRSPDGWAVRVSEVCDGHGLVISLAAGLAALAPDIRRAAGVFLGGVLAIQLFNLVRIVLLALTLDRAPGAFDLVHSGLFPYLTTALLACCLLPRRLALALCAAGLPLVAVWLPFQDSLSVPFVPVANQLLSVVSGPEVGQIAERAAGWTIGTGLLANSDTGQITRYLAPLRPADFTLALPVLLAAVALSRRPLWLPFAALSLTTALVVAGIATVWTLAAAQDPATLLIPDGDGFLTAPFTPPAAPLAALRLAQSVLVHLNLLVLPALIIGRRRHGA